MAQELVISQIMGRWAGRAPAQGRTAELSLWDMTQSFARLINWSPLCTPSHGTPKATSSRVSAPFQTHNVEVNHSCTEGHKGRVSRITQWLQELTDARSGAAIAVQSPEEPARGVGGAGVGVGAL